MKSDYKLKITLEAWVEKEHESRLRFSYFTHKKTATWAVLFKLYIKLLCLDGKTDHLHLILFHAHQYIQLLQT